MQPNLRGICSKYKSGKVEEAVNMSVVKGLCGVISYKERAFVIGWDRGSNA